MLLQLLPCLLLFFGLTFGLGWPLAARLKLEAAESLVASTLLSLLAIYLAAFAIFVFALPAGSFWALPLLASVGLLANRPALTILFRDPGVRALCVGQLLVSAWCVGWLFFVTTYYGGGWTSDWFEHWERTRFFLERWPADTKFLGVYALSARPPLANLVTGAFLSVTPATFAHYQLFTTLLNSLAFLPAALLVRRMIPAGKDTGRAAVAVLAVVVMLNPAFLQNATFAWTKLITVFFVLGGLYFFLRTMDSTSPRSAGPLCATALGAGILAHYSAGPYVLLLVAAWPLLNRARWSDAAFWRHTVLLGVIGGLVLATWFGWSFLVYGSHTTLLSNSSVNVKDAQSGNQLLKVALNLRDTVIPHFLRPLDGALIAQSSRWGYWHDWFFQIYQVNLFFIFGSVAWVVLLREVTRTWSTALPTTRWFWTTLVLGVIGLGVAVHGARDTWGLAHICLQGLLVLGLVFLAARWSELTRPWRLVLAAGALIDFGLGVILHFAMQSLALDLWFSPGRAPIEMLRSYSEAGRMNAFAKTFHHLEFFGDVLTLPPVLVLALLTGILTLAISRATRLSR